MARWLVDIYASSQRYKRDGALIKGGLSPWEREQLLHRLRVALGAWCGMCVSLADAKRAMRALSWEVR